MNFKDPLGLVRRMLTSGNSAAIWSLFQLAMEKAATPVDMVIGACQRSPDQAATSSEWPVILVTGPPRAGTTLASQLLMRYLDVSYFTNASTILPNAPIVVSRLVTGNFRPRRRANASNFYGQTFGLAGINDGFVFWNRWLGEDRYRVDESISPAAQRDMQLFISAWLDALRRPLLNKNNRNIDAIELLAEALPNAYFVIVERDPVQIVQSLKRARKFVQGSEDIGWGLFSADRSDRSQPFGNLDAICQQVASIQSRLNDQLSELAASRYLRVRYDDICAAPEQFVREVATLVPRLQVRDGLLREEAPTLSASQRVKLSDDEHRYVKGRLDELLNLDELDSTPTSPTKPSIEGVG